MGKVKIKQYTSIPNSTAVNAMDNLIVVVPKVSGRQGWPQFPHSELLKKRLGRRDDKESRAPLVTDLPNKTGTHVSLAAIKTPINAFELLTLARRLGAGHVAQNPAAIHVLLAGLDDTIKPRVAEAMVAALLAGVAQMPSFKKHNKTKAKRLGTVHLYGMASPQDFSRTLAEAEGNNLARSLTMLPPNELTPSDYRRRLTELSGKHGWRMRFLGIKALQKENAGAFLAVAQGSDVADAGIVHLHYSPPASARKNQRCLALVGKGICYDTGGTNLKPAKHMFGMHEDMEGSAVALGTLLALSQMKVGFAIDCWLALAQNHIGPKAYKQNDVVVASNGTSIEVVHTDAEGRMVLADTLALASRQRPDLIVDYATLTGACVGALSTRYSGAFTNRSALIPDILTTGQHSGERVWPFPSDPDFDKDLDSNIADIKQCAIAGEADHILATRFLSRFVDQDIPWVHIDLAAGNHKGGLAHIPTDITGFGVRFTTSLLLDQEVMEKQLQGSSSE